MEKNPRYADAYFYIGYCNYELKRYNEVITEFKESIRIKPDYGEPYFGLGLTYLLLGDNASAMQ
ncbi:MAG: tetratricopeptide repeat protein [Acidobacteria bacterium]|nr:MAG: tetratricopeptide repeat protein [Acidobacteriota bacterium]